MEIIAQMPSKLMETLLRMAEDSIDKPLSSLEGSSWKTGDSGESGMEEGQVVELRETTLPLLLSPARRISQWSDMEELVEPVGGTQ